MKTNKNAKAEIPFIRELCKEDPETEILEAEENFRDYLALISRISNRVVEEKSSGKSNSETDIIMTD